jgi:hypothetical protein
MEVSGALHSSAFLPPVPIARDDEWVTKPISMRYRESNPDRPARSLVTMLTELYSDAY